MSDSTAADATSACLLAAAAAAVAGGSVSIWITSLVSAPVSIGNRCASEILYRAYSSKDSHAENASTVH